MNDTGRRRVGLIGFGFIGSQVFARIVSDSSCGLEIAFVHNRSEHRIAAVPKHLLLHEIGELDRFKVDLVVEMAHPLYSEQWGEAILSQANYLPLSVTALADDALRDRLTQRALASNTTLAIPHGALMGLDSLREWRAMWRDVVISFYKNPANIDFGATAIDPATITKETVLYDGPVRGIAKLYPRNVNTMVTCALATVGLDQCRARLIADPSLTVAIAQVDATGKDGSVLTMRKEQPVKGVSGTEMFESQFASIVKAAGIREPLAFV